MTATNPARLRRHLERAFNFIRANQPEKAIEALRQSLVELPYVPELHNNLGSLLGQFSKDAEALECFERAVTLRPDYPQAWNNLGAALEQLQDFEGAGRAYRSAIKLRPNYTEAYVNLSNVLRKLHRPAEAVDAAHEWVSWFFDWLDANPHFANELFDCYVLNKRVLKEELAEGAPIAPLVPKILKRLRELMVLWMNGEPLNVIEAALGVPASKIGSCDRAREFVRRVPDISYAIGLITLVHRGRLESEGRPEDMPIRLATVAACSRGGHRTPESLAICYINRHEISRKRCREMRKQISSEMAAAEPNEIFRTTMKRVGKALRELSL